MADESGGASIDKLTISISATSSRAAKSIENLSQSLASLKMALTGVPGNLNALSASLNSLKEASAGVNSFASAIKALKSGFSGNALAQNAEKIGQAMLKLDKYIKPLDTSMSSLAKSAAEINTLMKSLSQAFNEAGTSADSAAKKMNVFRTSANSAHTASNSVNQLTGSVSKLKRATGGNALGKIFSGLKTAVSVVSIMQLGKAIAYVTKQSTDYIEALNLFTVSMGKYAEQGERFAERISTALGIDQGEALKNMGLFNNLATSFGVSSDQAYILSKNLTQLAYDFASFHNLDIEDSFLKFQSALAGELEPIRRVGVDISNARLQQELYELGIRKNISTLTRGDKALLTYIAIMKQASNEMGDMARTITTPANMLRVLQNQFVITARSIGNIFIPALQVVLPWVIAFVKVIGQAASALAAFFGFEMPDFSSVSNSVDMSGVAAQFDATGDAAEGASKKLNQLIGGFDELNIMQSKSSGASAGSEAIGSVLGDLDLSALQYDMLEGLVPTDDLVSRIKDAIKRMLQPFKDINFSQIQERFRSFFSTLGDQFSQFDFGQAFMGLYDSFVGVMGSILNLSGSIALPIIEALNIPQIVFSSLNLLTSLFSNLKLVINAVTPGVQAFVNKGLVPIASWIGGKISNAFNGLSKALDKIGEWFKDNEDKFTRLGNAVGEATGKLWEFISPITDAVWENFAGILSQIIEIGLNLIGLFTSLGTAIFESSNEATNAAQKFGIFTHVQNIFKNVVDGILGHLSAMLQGINGIITFLTGVFLGDWEAAWKGITQVVDGAFNYLVSTVRLFIGDFASLMKDWWNNSVKPWFSLDKWKELGRNAINALLSGLQSVASKISGFFENLFTFNFTGSTIKSGGASINVKSNTRNVPTFASGNVATEPTLALFGEYPNAAHNPEVTAPQSTIYETVVAANGEMVGALYQMASMIVQAIEDNSVEISADSKGIFKAVKKEAQGYQKAHGAPAF